MLLDARIAAFGRHGPEVFREEGAAKLKVLNAAIDHAVVGTSPPARLHRIAVPVLVQLKNVVEVAEIHMEMPGVGELFPEKAGFRGFLNFGFPHDEIRAADDTISFSILGRDHAIVVVIPTINEVTAAGERGGLGLRGVHERARGASDAIGRATQDGEVGGGVSGVEHRGEQGGPKIGAHAGQDVAPVIFDVHAGGGGDLADIIKAKGFVRGAFGIGQRGHEHGGENSDNADDHEEFDESEGVTMGRVGGARRHGWKVRSVTRFDTWGDRIVSKKIRRKGWKTLGGLSRVAGLAVGIEPKTSWRRR